MERAIEFLALGSVGEVLQRIDRVEKLAVVEPNSIAHSLRRDVIVVEHVGFEIPPNAQVERKPSRQAPIILQECANLLVVLLETRIAKLPIELIWISIIESENSGTPHDRIGKEEMWRLIVAFDDVVRQEIDVGAELEDVVAAGVESGVRDVITKAKPFLREILYARVASNPSDFPAASRRRPLLVFPRGKIGYVRRGIAAKALILDACFVEPCAGGVCVLEYAKANVLAKVDCRLCRGLLSEIAHICFVAVVKTEFETGVVA